MSKKKIIIIGSIVGIVVLMFVIRGINMSKKKADTTQTEVASTEVADNTTGSAPVTEVTTEAPQDSYKQQLGIGQDDSDGRVDVERDPSTEATTEEPKQTEPTYEVSSSVFAHTEVPEYMVNGSSCKNYLANVSLSDFGSFWGTSLTDDDFIGHKKYMVGVEQDNVTAEKGDLQSVGWLMDNIKAEKFQTNDAIKFTNLHIIGSLATDHVAVLCCYDWYSAFGLDQTLVVFEDISNTLDVKSYNAGDVFSATVFVHNIKIESVNGQDVIVVQYIPFGKTNNTEPATVEMNPDAQSHMQK